MLMNRVIPSAAVLVLFTTFAGAADIPMATKAPVAPPPPSVSGYVEAYTGWAWTKDDSTFCFPGCDSFSDRFNGWVLGGAGRVNYWWASNASVQLDAQAEGTSYRFSDSSPGSGHFSSQSYLVGGHASWRDPARGLVGIFGGAGDIGGAVLVGSNVRHGLIGLEAQMYLSALTLYGQVGYDSSIGDIFPGFDGFHTWFVRGTARYNVQPNFRLEGTVLYADGSYDFSDNGSGFPPPSADFETWLWRAKAEYKFMNSPFAVFATYQGSRTSTDQTDSFGTESHHVTDHRALAGIRLYLGENTLQWNDNWGTTLDIIDPLGVPSATFTGGQMLVSDARLKRDIELVAHLDNGLGLYRYRYLWSDVVYVGVMAQEVAELYPTAVVRGTDGYLRVNYGSLGLTMLTFSEWNALKHTAGL